MSVAELFEHLDMPTWVPGPGGWSRMSIRPLVLAEIEGRLLVVPEKGDNLS